MKDPSAFLRSVATSSSSSTDQPITATDISGIIDAMADDTKDTKDPSPSKPQEQPTPPTPPPEPVNT